MGNCYSNQGRHSQHGARGSDILPRLPRSTAVSCSSLHSDSGALSFLQPYEIDEGMDPRIHTAPPYSKSRPPTHRGFGFRAPSSRVALAKARASNESLDSDHRASDVSLDVKTAYEPKDQKTWRMIDDESRSMSLKSGESAVNKVNKTKCAEDDIMNANVTEDNTQRCSSLARPTKLVQPGVLAAKRGVPPRGPLAKFTESHYGSGRGWVKAADADKTEVKVKEEKKDSVKKERLPTLSSSQKVREIKETETKEVGKAKKGGFLKRSFFKKSKSAPTNVVKESCVVASPPPLSPPEETAELDNRLSSDFSSNKDSKNDDCGNRQLEEEITTASLADLVSMAPSIAPMASIDCLETTSVGSINSDDLMLDLDIGLDDVDYEEKETQRSRANSYKVRSRSRSQSNDDLDDPAPKQALQRQDSVCKTSSGTLHNDCIVESPCEALDELASLLDNNPLLRRNPRLTKASRPCSFPGPRQRARSDVADEPSPLSMKPPRDTPSFGDEEIVTMDGFTYRQLLQDIRTYKTMLLKLKRIIQQDEIGTPWKNGLMFPGSNPSSPCHEEVYRPLVGESPTTDRGLMDDLAKENLELKEQNQVLSKQKEQQDRTIKLLQQQMENLNGYKINGKDLSTKYECGHLGPGGKAFTNATVQTDRALAARLPRYDKATTKPSEGSKVATPASSGSAPRQRGELRSNASVEQGSSTKTSTQRRPAVEAPTTKASQLRKVPRSKSINDGKLIKTECAKSTTSASDLQSSKSFDVAPKTPQRPLSTGSAITAQKSSKLPGLRVQRYTRTEAHQLRSFSNLARHQPPS
ncbi:hypothetical protein CAPTEDRAFT_221576 [Capitella teleta]|uniref:Uncharacterized protein n=1 Tax=Capitella teleta TaxID=283909 RepID=R7VG86_CAPTE|nr:hypothetical protein CAPTEDRAFT_221576 [Capitella teleta]|eukprot:ELU15316.1 hypothetical protein CAPTEDRAFT_221576 [Capitella teleta]